MIEIFVITSVKILFSFPSLFRLHTVYKTKKSQLQWLKKKIVIITLSTWKYETRDGRKKKDMMNEDELASEARAVIC